ncbi:putative ADP-heptose synthase [Desulfamplus magnetovallimortis]|uniref:D-glycero-beta-D-manno-heptose 1-phosphate adenylyltransferase n=1 Tax=Desulfamplus magnetovallimortis TaxID=1246637 RepID=A0A1W1HCM1_9BACT|nr:D-glycero-beta-D-manno-heptose 1-phosphate adenylyltransferase [Desulfamplus magnetovallimortis]SLM30125.1 putative ADP-heptose synthase [Desulfamplus magnetovallimortis]
MKKILPYNEAQAVAATYKASGSSIVFTNGCFDILHAGHLSYLEEAARQGDILMIGLNSDLSVQKIKGEKRPIISQDHRSRLLAALEFVDHVILFDDADPSELINKVMPDVLVKGADWPEEKIVGADTVKAHGGRVERIDLLPGISTTAIIEKIVAVYCGDQ